MDRIAVTNQKGVSKTTNVINVAGALAGPGVDVLAVDMDPQGISSTGSVRRRVQSQPADVRGRAEVEGRVHASRWAADAQNVPDEAAGRGRANSRT
ncbi:hypothetical protein EXE46_11620 [Halorubrum sp. GN11_10-6_MGM]|uniref:ParA family protein n=1 Tax=Halorubrum sp. GN11_10-6_MGM TaxID=2518112 RepID=UPI0010F80E8E|nr:AAA family ATPase [Halorubrum sp. GN11_10-6_MGM]TKX73973.1 hypothetical protein EXE46_11620 [Halorubrum sp. GN11_10-6_MGM]